jgi:membrane protein DedA with SNARE-associated domain
MEAMGMDDLTLAYWLGCLFWTAVGFTIGFLLGRNMKDIAYLKKRIEEES